MRYLHPSIPTFLLAILPLTACHRGEEAAVEEKPVVEVHAAKVTTRPVADLVVATGTIYPVEKAAVAAKISAPIRRMAQLMETNEARDPIAISSLSAQAIMLQPYHIAHVIE